jgi:transposase
MERKKYPGELNDEEWELIRPIVDKKQKVGRHSKYGKRKLLDAIFYILRSGCSWRLLPHDFPPWQTVYSQFRKWRDEGVFQELNDYVRKKLRVLLGRTEDPSAAIIDSQSVKTTEKGGLQVTMLERKLKEGKDISRLTPKDSCYRRLSRLRTLPIKKGSKSL